VIKIESIYQRQSMKNIFIALCVVFGVGFHLQLHCQTDYSCRGYGGMFNNNLTISPIDSIFVATLPNSYGNSDIKIGLCRPVLNTPPQCSLTKRPCVVLVHGGGWVASGSTNIWRDILSTFSPLLVPDGFITASIKYRLGIGGGNEFAFLSGNGCLINPQSDVTNAVGRSAHDVQLALKYLTDNADSLGIDKDAIFLVGFSAGGFNVMNATYLETGDSLYGWRMPSRAKVRGVINVAGALVHDSILSTADIKVPLLLFHGTCDDVVPLADGRILLCPDNAPFRFSVHGSSSVYSRAVSLGIPAEFHAVCGAKHDAGLSDSLTAQYSICKIRNWLARLLYNRTMPTYSDYRVFQSATCGTFPCKDIQCVDSVALFIPTSIADAQTPNHGITLFPQPTHRDLTIALNDVNTQERITDIIITDYLGNIVFNDSQNQTDEQKRTITLNTLPSGLYCVRIALSSGLITYSQCVVLK
jgi:predicted esterase